LSVAKRKKRKKAKHFQLRFRIKREGNIEKKERGRESDMSE
jgi:hypothetical protein